MRKLVISADITKCVWEPFEVFVGKKEKKKEIHRGRQFTVLCVPRALCYSTWHDWKVHRRLSGKSSLTSSTQWWRDSHSVWWLCSLIFLMTRLGGDLVKRGWKRRSSLLKAEHLVRYLSHICSAQEWKKTDVTILKSQMYFWSEVKWRQYIKKLQFTLERVIQFVVVSLFLLLISGFILDSIRFALFWR